MLYSYWLVANSICISIAAFFQKTNVILSDFNSVTEIIQVPLSNFKETSDHSIYQASIWMIYRVCVNCFPAVSEFQTGHKMRHMEMHLSLGAQEIQFVIVIYPEMFATKKVYEAYTEDENFHKTVKS